MILHTLNKAQSQTELNQQLTNTCTNNDSVLLIEDGVYQLLDPSFCNSTAHWSYSAKKIYALINDAAARGISENNLDNNIGKISFISYAQFVELSAAHSKTISWY